MIARRPHRRHRSSARLPLGQQLIQAMKDLIDSETGETATRVTEIDTETGQSCVSTETGSQTAARHAYSQVQGQFVTHEAADKETASKQVA